MLLPLLFQFTLLILFVYIFYEAYALYFVILLILAIIFTTVSFHYRNICRFYSMLRMISLSIACCCLFLFQLMLSLLLVLCFLYRLCCCCRCSWQWAVCRQERQYWHSSDCFVLTGFPWKTFNEETKAEAYFVLCGSEKICNNGFLKASDRLLITCK